MMHKENQLILELCKFEYAKKNVLTEQMKKQLDYPYILGQLLYNRVGVMAYSALKEHELLHTVNREFRNTLKAIYEYNFTKVDSFVESLKMLQPICTNFNFPYAFLKGAYLVDLYPKGLRTSNDIDILIMPENITDLSNALKISGFHQGNIRSEKFVSANRTEIISSRINRGETVPFVKEVDLPGMKYLEIDVNFSLGFRPGMDDQVVRDFLSRTQPLILSTVSTLNKTDFLIHLCVHLYKEATVMSWVEMGRDISLYKYCDIYLFIQRFMEEKLAAELIRRINDVELNKECYYALYHTKELFGVENKSIDRLLSEIQPADLSFMTQVLEPQTGKIYSCDIDYRDWVFCNNRKEKLYEA